MTETEIRKLRETVLQLWEGSEYLLLVREDLFEYVQNLKKELAEKFSRTQCLLDISRLWGNWWLI